MKYKVAWGPDQMSAIGALELDGASEADVKRQAKKWLADNSYHGMKVLYAVPLPEKENERA